MWGQKGNTQLFRNLNSPFRRRGGGGRDGREGGGKGRGKEDGWGR